MKIRLVIISLLYFVSFYSCKQTKKELQNFENEMGGTSKKGFVIMILAPDCPLCINYANEFVKLKSEFETDFSFVPILPGNSYSEIEIIEFKEKTGMHDSIYRDKNWSICKSLGATVTPEFFVLSGGEILYQGKLDDWAAVIGQKKVKATEFYLRDALRQLASSKPIKIKQTKPVGCLLEIPE